MTKFRGRINAFEVIVYSGSLLARDEAALEIEASMNARRFANVTRICILRNARSSGSSFEIARTRVKLGVTFL